MTEYSDSSELDTETDYSIHEFIGVSNEQVLTHDPIHDSFYLPKLVWKIIDTSEFQRLRNIKQTGNTCYVYIGSEHTRFSHCIGVAHLCNEFGSKIVSDHPDLLDKRKVYLLTIAGLVHDLGHCAYSHLYDSTIVKIFDPTSKFTHEQASYEILQLMHKKYDWLKDALTLEEIDIIGKLIFGSYSEIPEVLKSQIQWNEWDYKHMFYYEILSNKRTGIDVDKFDYLKRDSHYTGVKTTFEPNRMIQFYIIDKHKNGNDIQYQLEYHPKANELIEVMWQSRNDLHRRVYQHRVVKCIDLMVTEMITLCANYDIIPGIKLCHAHNHMDAYCKLTDSKISEIAEQVPQAKKILDDITNRRLWPTIATVQSVVPLDFNFNDPNVIINMAKLRKDIRIYYIYYKDIDNLHNLNTSFYRNLLKDACGASITLRKLKD